MAPFVSGVIRCALGSTLSLCVLLVPCRSVAQPEIVDKFLFRSHTFQGTTLGYRLFVPEGYTSSKRYPIVLTLHGNGAQGSDNLRQMEGTRFATSWADPLNQVRYPCFVVVPQCRAGYFWVTEAALSPDLATANDILDSLAREFTIDTARMYVTGVSMGGVATWHLITLFPERFAAAVPVSAEWVDYGAPLIGPVAIWVFTGVQDVLVPVAAVRKMIDAFRQVGRQVVYTHCHDGNCTGLSDSVILAQVNNRADLFYTEVRGAGHDPGLFNFAYDYPFLRSWLFDRIRIKRGLVTLTTAKSYRTLRSVEPITWTAPNPQDSVEIRLSPNVGTTWQTVAASLPNTGSYMWNTQEVSDCALGLLRIYLKNLSGQTYSYDQSGSFAVDNGVHGKPLARILDPFPFWSDIIDSSTATLEYFCGSSKRESVSVQIYYSADRGVTFTQFDTHPATGDTAGRKRVIDLVALPNSEHAVLRLDVANGTSISSDTTSLLHPFLKRTPRKAGPIPAQVSGPIGTGTVIVHIVDASRLTGDQYRVSIDASSSLGKYYDVENESKGVKVVQEATQLDGDTEGPQFDGIRLVVSDPPFARVDRDSSGWKVGVSTLLDVQITLLSLNYDGQMINGYAYPADYRITVFDHSVDTSSESIFGTGRIPVNFWIWNTTENRKSDFVFLDSDNDGRISSLDEIFILEPDSLGGLRLTWDLFFVGVPPATTVPGPGDQFVFRTRKPLKQGDAFTFKGIISLVRIALLPETPKLFQNFPNPFNPTTTIRYVLSSRSHVTLTIYNTLGQIVKELVNGEMEAGYHEVQFDASGLSSGVYFYRLQAGTFVGSKRLLLLR
jgi:poly(3-hydroxybutyrate) depolymerase